MTHPVVLGFGCDRRAGTAGGWVWSAGTQPRTCCTAVRFCSGLTILDRALAAAGSRFVEVDLTAAGVVRHPEAWQALGMDASDSGDVVFDSVPVASDAAIGHPGWYVGRVGFVFGGTGVAAVLLGAAGVLDGVHELLREKADEHQLAHFGALHTAIAAADAMPTATAGVLEDAPDPPLLNDTCRASVEQAPARCSTARPAPPAPRRCAATARSPSVWPTCRSSSASTTVSGASPRWAAACCR